MGTDRRLEHQHQTFPSHQNGNKTAEKQQTPRYDPVKNYKRLRAVSKFHSACSYEVLATRSLGWGGSLILFQTNLLVLQMKPLNQDHVTSVGGDNGICLKPVLSSIALF